MRISGFGRCALSSCVAVAILAGCSVLPLSLSKGQDDMQPPIGAPGTTPQSRTIARGQVSHRSWVDAGAARGALLYVSDTVANSVSIYSYPRLKLMGKLFGIHNPAGLCVDPRTSAVWVVSEQGGRVVEFAHGGAIRIRTLKISAGFIQACAVDASGNLAVVTFNEYDDHGGLLIFKNARGKPTFYQSRKMFFYSFAGYDNRGNVFVDGSPYATLLELPAGGTKLKNVTPNGLQLSSPGAVQYDGADLAVGDQKTGIIYRVSGTKIAGTTQLNGTCFVQQFFVDTESDVVIAPNVCSGKGDVLIYDYPAGGTATRRITGFTDPFAAVVSR